MKQKGSNRLKYFWRIWLTTLKFSLSKASTYRIEVISRALRGIFLVFVQIIFIRAVLGNASDFAGWSLDEMYLLTGLFNLINYISWSLFSINLWRLEEKIFKGEFDFILMKPMSSIFAASFEEFFIDDAVSGISGLILVVYYFARHFTTITVAGVVGGLITILCAFIIWFSLELLVASFDFVSIKNGLREVKKQIAGIGKFPVDIWEGNLKLVFYSIIPVAFVASVPARVLTGIYKWEYVLGAVVVSSLFFLFARAVWYWNLRKYTSVG